jgi:MFS transporter, ACS family, hexuronate transporter
MSTHALPGKPAASPGRIRWTICALLFVATTLNYMDRQVLGILSAPLGKQIGWSEAQYGYIVTAFQTAYAIGLIGFGRLIDRFGTRAGYALAVGWWSMAAAVHALAGSVGGFAGARFLLGLGESGNFPAAVKTVAEWFPRKERALAVGLFNCGSNIGAIVAPLLVPWIALRYGWRYAFLITPVIGLCWVCAWLVWYRRPEHHRSLTAAELAHIQSDGDAPAGSVSFARLLGYREVWALVIARFLTDPVWWFYLYWAPKFFYTRYGLRLDQIGMPLVIVYLIADGGAVFGGWLSSDLIRRGFSVNAARKLTILVCALMVVPVSWASQASEMWLAVLLLGLATAGHQGWASNLFAMISDLFPKHAVSSVTGLTGFGGSVGGMLAASAIGLTLEATGSYVPVFVWAGSSYLVILAIIQLFIPRIERVETCA